MMRVTSTRDARCPAGPGHCSAAVCGNPWHAFAVTRLRQDNDRARAGAAVPPGEGSPRLGEAARFDAWHLAGQSGNMQTTLPQP